jgi:hypothetical protein
MICVTVFTAKGRPTFEAPDDSSPAVIRKLVASKYGFVQIGVAHTWVGQKLASPPV